MPDFLEMMLNGVICTALLSFGIAINLSGSLLLIGLRSSSFFSAIDLSYGLKLSSC
jgi:hypothetical protein